MLNNLTGSSALPLNRIQLLRELSDGSWDQVQEVEVGYDLDALLALDREHAQEPENRGKPVVVKVVEVNLSRATVRTLPLPARHERWLDALRLEGMRSMRRALRR